MDLQVWKRLSESSDILLVFVHFKVKKWACVPQQMENSPPPEVPSCVRVSGPDRMIWRWPESLRVKRTQASNLIAWKWIGLKDIYWFEWNSPSSQNSVQDSAWPLLRHLHPLYFSVSSSVSGIIISTVQNWYENRVNWYTMLGISPSTWSSVRI